MCVYMHVCKHACVHLCHCTSMYVSGLLGSCLLLHVCIFGGFAEAGVGLPPGLQRMQPKRLSQTEMHDCPEALRVHAHHVHISTSLSAVSSHGEVVLSKGIREEERGRTYMRTCTFLKAAFYRSA